MFPVELKDEQLCVVKGIPIAYMAELCSRKLSGIKYKKNRKKSGKGKKTEDESSEKNNLPNSKRENDITNRKIKVK